MSSMALRPDTLSVKNHKKELEEDEQAEEKESMEKETKRRRRAFPMYEDVPSDCSMNDLFKNVIR